ncbi:FG-GAP repeat protein [candidate division WWE3 bacterium]|nr:FG-GAP repeat protein [candidate division WWE3 bacterium]
MHNYNKFLAFILSSISIFLVILDSKYVHAASTRKNYYGDGSISSTVEINDATTNGPELIDSDLYGSAVENIGDLDGDGVNDLVVGIYGDDTGGTRRGAVGIHFMNSDGSVKSTVEINDSTTNGPDLSDSDFYGNTAENMGDLDGDGVNDIAVGAYADDNGGTNRGAIHIHFMNSDGSIKSTVEINDGTTNGPTLSDNDTYGAGIANMGDLDNDGVTDIAVGAYADDNGGTNRGAIHIHFMNSDGSVKSTVEINDSTTNGPTLSDGDLYGFSLENIGDLDDDGINDIAVGATSDDNGGSGRGAIHIHFMNSDGSVKSTVEINDGTTNGPTLSDSDAYGIGIAGIGDLNDDDIEDIAVGAYADDNGGTNRGAIHIHFMNSDGSVKSTVEINDGTTNGPTLSDSDLYGASIANIGDLNDDNVADIAVGAYRDDNGGTDRGAIHIHFMTPLYTTTYLEDTSCNDRKPDDTTWIKFEPIEKDGVTGMFVTWTQYSADYVKIKIDDGTGNFPWEIAKTRNDGNIFLENVTTWQNIKMKGINGCRSGDYSPEVSYSSYPSGWYNVK